MSDVLFRYEWFALTVNKWEKVYGIREFRTLEGALKKLGIVKEKYRVAFDAEPADGHIRIVVLRPAIEWVYSAAE